MKKIYFFVLGLLSFVYAQNIERDTIDLKESIVYNKAKYKLKRFGPDTKSQKVLVGLKADLNMKNDSMPKIVKGFAVYINAPKKEYSVEQLNLNFGNKLENPIRLKIDLVQNIKEENRKSLLKEPLFLTISNENQDEENVFHYNLKELSLKNKDEFYIYVELLEELEKPTFFSAALFSKCYYQPEDQNVWHKTPLGISPSINVDLLIKK